MPSWFKVFRGFGFCIPHRRPPFDKSLFAEFEKIFSRSIRKKYNLSVELVPPGEAETPVQRWTAKIWLPVENRKEKINIEVCSVPSYDNEVMMVSDYYPDDNKNPYDNILIRTESLREILADKVVAIGARKYVKYRDIWDVKWLSDRGVPLDIKMVKNKISACNIKNFNRSFREKIKLIENSGSDSFDQEMSRFLTPSMAEQVKKMGFFDSAKKSVLAQANKFLKSGDRDIEIG